MTIDSTRRSRARRWRVRMLAFALAGVLAACAAAPTPPEKEAPPEPLGIDSVQATSQTSIAVAFDQVPGPEVGEAANYQVLGPDGRSLDVVAVHLRPDAAHVVLTTAPQLVVPYALTVVGVGRADGAVAAAPIEAPGTFAGSDVPAPVLASAIALDAQRVLLTFEDPVTGARVELEDAATEASRYAVIGGATVLGVGFAASGSDRGRVIVATSVQDDLPYEVRASVVAASGVPIDPFRASAPFTGIAASDAVPPTVAAVSALDDATVRVAFSEPLGATAREADRYTIRDADGATVPVSSATLNDVGTEALLSTWPMVRGGVHELEVDGVRDRSGNALLANATSFRVPTGEAPVDDQPPRVVGAISTGATTIVVSFDEPVRGGSTSAENPAHYSITDVASASVVSPQAVVLVQQAQLSASGRSVTLTTLEQSASEYALRVANVVDLAGNQIVGPDRDRPYHVVFRGTAGTGPGLDSDGDGLTDAEEQAGWTVTVRLADGRSESRVVTSDPFEADTDGDGESDRNERAYGSDPRRADTDGDALTDFQELNQIYSEPTDQDTDGDGLVDGLEFDTFRTSPLLADTDGDQLLDGDEVVLANRNPRIADLPAPAIEVGAIDLSLDTRFTATSVAGTRELESKTTSSTLSQTEAQSYSNTDSNTHEFFAKASAGVEYSLGGDAGVGQLTGNASIETGYTGQWSSSFTRESSQETVRAYEASRQTDVETTREESVAREVVGAAMRATVTLRSIGNIAFTITNVEVTAFTLDPRDPSRLIPVATLQPQAGANASYNLGPLIPQRGPLVFESSEVFPSTIEALMRDPRGLVFKVANFDLTDEFGRNFAFTSQDINDRTAPLVIDFGGQDADGDGLSDASARYRVATSSGRIVGDVNGDGVVDDLDRTVYDPLGRQVGITLTEALEDIVGLTGYDEEDDPTSSLSAIEIIQSFSVRTVPTPSGPVTVLWRIGDVASGEPADRRAWEILTPTGIDRGVDFDDRVLRTEDGVTLAYVQDVDGDRVTARWEYLLGCSDQLLDTDGDGIGDYEEIYVGWEVLLPTGSYTSYPNCARTDSDLDGLDDFEEEALGTDPLLADTDGDGLTDVEEVRGYRVALRFGIDPATSCTAVVGQTDVVECLSDPLDPFTDGDTLTDGDERRLGTDPTVSDGDRALDNDGDGLVNFEEEAGWNVEYRALSTVPNEQGALITCTPASSDDCGAPPTSDPNVGDTDGDGLSDGVERLLGLHPRLADTDGDGISDFDEVRFVPGADVWELVYDPLDADIDDDLRTDGDELDVPITVRIVGETPYDAFSSPFVADEDLDDLVDGEEEAAETDPTEFDTDGDGTGDGVEVARNADFIFGNDTNPLAPDQLLQLAFAGLAVENGTFSLICGDTDRISDGHFLGGLYYTINATESGPAVFDAYFNAATWLDLSSATVIYRGGSIAARASDLQAVENVAGIRRDMNAINPDNTPVVPAGGGFTPLLTATQQIWTTDAVGTSNACTMRIRFTITPITD